jgi:2-phosphinomethylmalic acid synthase
MRVPAAAAVWTTETTHRDGQQGGLPLTVEQGIRIYELQCAFTGDSGALRQAEFFVYREADRRMLLGALERYADGAPVEPTTWIRASAKDAALVAGIGVRETGMLASASDYPTRRWARRSPRSTRCTGATPTGPAPASTPTD